MAIGLAAIAFINVLIGDLFEVIILALFMYNLYQGYARFDYCSMLVFMIYSVMQSLFFLMIVIEKYALPSLEI